MFAASDRGASGPVGAFHASSDRAASRMHDARQCVSPPHGYGTIRWIGPGTGRCGTFARVPAAGFSSPADFPASAAQAAAQTTARGGATRPQEVVVLGAFLHVNEPTT